jgi:hypothetical protein
LVSGHKSGGLVLVLAWGPSTHPKNARDLTKRKGGTGKGRGKEGGKAE